MNGSPGELCARCKTPMVCGHTLSLDVNLANWRLCCLCTGELIQQLSGNRAATK